MKTNNRIALVIGINYYKHHNPLRYSVSSAKAIYRLLTSPKFGNCNQNKSKLLTVENEIDFSPQELSKAIVSTLEELQPGDQFIFYFCGHGRVLYEDFFLILPNSPIGEKFRLHSYDFSQLAKALRFAEVNKAILIIDTCHSGAMIKSMKDFMGSNDWTPTNLPTGVAYIAATGEINNAKQAPQFKKTLFAHYFHEAITKYPYSDKPFITANGIKNEINKKINEKHKEEPQRTHVWTSEVEEEIWISLNPSFKRAPNNKAQSTNKVSAKKTKNDQSLVDNSKYMIRTERIPPITEDVIMVPHVIIVPEQLKEIKVYVESTEIFMTSFWLTSLVGKPYPYELKKVQHAIKPYTADGWRTSIYDGSWLDKNTALVNLRKNPISEPDENKVAEALSKYSNKGYQFVKRKEYPLEPSRSGSNKSSDHNTWLFFNRFNDKEVEKVIKQKAKDGWMFMARNDIQTDSILEYSQLTFKVPLQWKNKISGNIK